MTKLAKSRTCIALIKLRDGRLMMGGDRRVSESWGRAYQCPFPKISKKSNGMIIGASGDSAICKLVVDLFDPPAIETDLDTYMFYPFQKALTKLLMSQPGFVDDHRMLSLPPDTSCGMLIGIESRAFIVNIVNFSQTSDPVQSSCIIVDDVPLPFVIGCGSGAAYPILHSNKTNKNINTKAQLLQAMTVAAELSPGCDNTIDLITTD